MQPSRTKSTFFKGRRTTALPWGKTATSVQHVPTRSKTFIWATPQAVSSILFLFFCPFCSRQTTLLSHPGLPVGGQCSSCVVSFYVPPLHFVPHRTCGRQLHIFWALWTSPVVESQPGDPPYSRRSDHSSALPLRGNLEMLCNRKQLPQSCGDLSFCSLAFLLILCQIPLSNEKYNFLFF